MNEADFATVMMHEIYNALPDDSSREMCIGEIRARRQQMLDRLLSKEIETSGIRECKCLFGGVAQSVSQTDLDAWIIAIVSYCIVSRANGLQERAHLIAHLLACREAEKPFEFPDIIE